MQCITLDIETGQLSAELAHRGISPSVRVHVLVEVPDDTDAPEDEFDLPMAAIAQSGGAFDFLADEPDLYTEVDPIERYL
jgi:hypothetical protein